MDPKTPRSSPPYFPQRWPSRWLVLAACLLCAPPLAYWAMTYKPALSLSYGQFRQKLEKDEVRSVKVGPSWIAGELKAPGPNGRPARFQTSRLGMENDQELVALLKAHIPNA